MRQAGLIEPPTLAFRKEDEGLFVDLESLILSRLLIMSSSRAGKGWLLRSMLEKTRDMVPHLVFDWEGELTSLREIHPYVVIGSRDEGADQELRVETARLLSRRLMAARASVIVDLSVVESEVRREYVSLFLHELIELPRDQWHLRMVVVDEAQELCPQVGEETSSSAVKQLVSRGGKRGLGAIIVSQRFAKLHKDVTEVGARIAGRTFQSVDLVRVADELGLTKAEAKELRTYPTGQFLAVGSAFGLGGIQMIRAGETITKPIKLSMGLGTPTPAEIAAALQGLKSHAGHVAEDAGRLELVEEIERLQDQIRSLKDGNVSDPADIARAVAAAERPLRDLISALELKLERCRHHAAAIFLGLGEIPPVADVQTSAEAAGQPDERSAIDAAAEKIVAADVDAYQAQILDAIASTTFKMIHRDALAIKVGAASRKSSKFRHALGELRKAGLVVYPRELHVAIAKEPDGS